MRYAIGILLLTAPAADAQVRAPAPAAPAVAPAPLPRGPLRARLATAGADVVTDTTMRLLNEVPRAVADSVRGGNARLTFRFSVTRTPPR